MFRETTKLFISLMLIPISAPVWQEAAFCQHENLSTATFTISLGIFTSNGMFIENVRQQNLRVKGVSGLRLLGEDRAGRRILLLLDNSSSMKYVWQEALLFCRTLINHLGKKDSLAFALCGTKDDLFLSFTRAFPSVISKVASVHESKTDRSGASFKKSVTRAFGVEDRTFGDTIILVSDDLELGTVPSDKDSEDSIISAGARLFLVRLWNANGLLARLSISNLLNPTNEPAGTESTSLHLIRREAERSSERAERLAFQTGGTTVDPWFLALQRGQGLVPAVYPFFITEAARVTFDMICKVYRVEIDLPASVKRPQSLDIKLADDRGFTLDTVQILCPRKLMPQSGRKSPSSYRNSPGKRTGNM